MLTSVVIPVYNAEQFLGRSVESVLGQSHRDLELLLVNDGSTDGSAAMCERYARSDNRIKVISEENRGPSAARNTGILNANGSCVFFLDADDFIRHDTLEVLTRLREKTGAGLIMSNFNKLENSGQIVRQPVTFRCGESPFAHDMRQLASPDMAAYVRHFLQYPSNHPVSYCWAKLYDMSIIKQRNLMFRENMRLFEDFVFNLDYMCCTDKTVFVNDDLYTYTMHNRHVSTSMAIIDSNSLLRDMHVFREKTLAFLTPPEHGAMNETDARKAIGHALAHYVIIFTIRSCRLITRHNKRRIRDEIRNVVNADIFRESLGHYQPSGGNSRIIPLLMRLRIIRPLIFFCKRRATKRYGGS